MVHLEDQVPVEAAAKVGRRADVLERVHADDVNHWTHHPTSILEGKVKNRLGANLTLWYSLVEFLSAIYERLLPWLRK